MHSVNDEDIENYKIVCRADAELLVNDLYNVGMGEGLEHDIKRFLNTVNTHIETLDKLKTKSAFGGGANAEHVECLTILQSIITGGRNSIYQDYALTQSSPLAETEAEIKQTGHHILDSTIIKINQSLKIATDTDKLRQNNLKRLLLKKEPISKRDCDSKLVNRTRSPRIYLN